MTTNLPVPSPRSFQVNEFETGANLNSIRDALNFLLNPPLAVLIQNTVQAIPNAALTAVTFDATVVDTYGGHSNTTNNTRYTAQVPGWYDAFGVAGYVNNTTGVRVAEIFKNGTGLAYSQDWFANTGVNAASPIAYTPVFLAAGDYLELDTYQTSGGALNTIITGPQSALMVCWRHV